MRQVTAHLFSSIDGVVEDPSVFQFDRFGPEEGEAMGTALASVDEVVMGRVIYEEWAQYWPGQDEDFGAFINPVPKHVASTTLIAPLTWQASSLIDGDLLEHVRTRRELEGGDITVMGISVIRQLLLAGLLDRLSLTVHPAAAGRGKRLFDGVDAPVRLELLDSQITSVGNAMLTYGPYRA